MGSIKFLILFIPSGIFGFILGGNFALVGQPSLGASGAVSVPSLIKSIYFDSWMESDFRY
jgi:hypothetical protein